MGIKPANTYIFPLAAAPRISSAGSGNGASFSHFACANAEGAVALKDKIATANCKTINTIFLNAMFGSRVFGCAVLYNGRPAAASLQRFFPGDGLSPKSTVVSRYESQAHQKTAHPQYGRPLQKQPPLRAMIL